MGVFQSCRSSPQEVLDEFDFKIDRIVGSKARLQGAELKNTQTAVSHEPNIRKRRRLL